MRNQRWMAWTGPLFAVVFLAITLLLGSSPSEKASAQKVVNYYNSHQGRTLTGVFLTPALAALLVLFASYVRTVVRDRYPGAGPGPSMMLGGAVLWAAGIFVGATLGLALLTAADNHQNQAAQSLNVLSAASWLPFIAGIAITLIGAGMSVLSTGVLARWMGWVALVGGIVALAGPGGFVGFFLGPLWLLVAGIMLARQQPDVVVPQAERVGV
jgi:MFS family permease